MNEAAITFAHRADGVLEAQQLGLLTPAEAISRLQQFVVEFQRDEKSELDNLFQYFHPALVVVHTACAASSEEFKAKLIPFPPCIHCDGDGVVIFEAGLEDERREACAWCSGDAQARFETQSNNIKGE